jgi:tetratricopeptide (TPR) repeat protein
MAVGASQEVAPSGAVLPAAEVMDGARYFAQLRRAETLFRSGALRQAAELFAGLWASRREDPGLALRAGEAYALAGQREAALPLLEEAWAGGAGIRYELALDLARLHARLDHAEPALDWLARAIEERFTDRPGLAADPSFVALRDLPRFRELVGMEAPPNLARRAGWEFDLDRYVAEVERMHVGPDRPGRSPEFRGALARLRESIDTRTDAAIALELQRITASLGDGHSVVYPVDTPRVSFRALPIRPYLFADGAWIVAGEGEGDALRGSEIVAIGGLPFAEVLERAKPYVSRDNEMGVAWFGPLFVVNPVLLESIGAARPGAAVELRLRGGDGVERTTELRSGPLRSFSGASQRLPPPPGADAEAAPLWIRARHEPFAIEERSEDDFVHLLLNQIEDAPGKSLEELADEVRQILVETGFSNLVLDLRNNSGGNNFLVSPLVRLVAWFEAASPDHRVFVVTGRSTFSACQNLVNRLERNCHVIVAGEPSSSRPNFTGESTEVALPWSGLRLSISSRWWQDSHPEDLRPWIAPHVPVRMTSADWFTQRDPTIAAIVEVIAAGS